MAIYHLRAQIIQRSKGKNVVAAAAYRRAARLKDHTENRYFNYSSKPDVIYSELIVPNDAPDWVNSLKVSNSENTHQESENLWNLVANGEKRKDAQLARELEIALPIELNQQQNIELIREYIKDQFVSRGMLADFSIHWDEGNPHAHILLTMREITPEGFGKKVTAWHAKEMIQTWRSKWSEYANIHLYKHGIDAKIDHRSYQEQGIDLVPGIHQGKAVTDMDRRGITTERKQVMNGIRRENLRRICENPEIILRKMTHESSTFTTQGLAEKLGYCINDRDGFSHLDIKLIPTSNYSKKQALMDTAGEFSINLATAQSLHSSNTSVASFESQKNFSPVSMEGIHELLRKNHDEGRALSPDIISKIFQSIEYHQAVFSDKDLVRAIAPYTDNAELFAQAVFQIKTSPQLLSLGAGEDGRERYTTQKMFKLENKIQSLGDALRDKKHVKISKALIDQVLVEYEIKKDAKLTDEQIAAIKYITGSSSISCLVGRAGTGKSFSLGAARDVWESTGLQVYGVALSGIAADGLAKDAGINSKTIESFRYALSKNKIRLDAHSVIVMDEAGMTDSEAMLSIVEAVYEARGKLVLVGDHGQLQPVGPGASFRALLERLGCESLETVYRQKAQWQKEATQLFSRGAVKTALEAYDAKDCIHFAQDRHQTIDAIAGHWLAARHSHQHTHLKEFLVVAHRNEDVALLNHRLRTERIAAKEIAEGYFVQTGEKVLQIAQGDRIIFLENNASLSVKNGRFASIKSVDFFESGRVSEFTVILDGSGQEVKVNPAEYNKFDYGYAATVHKTQGITVDHAIVYAGGISWDRNLTYVAMTRHRESCHLYADQESFADMTALEKSLSKLGIKDSVLDYPLAFAERRGIDTQTLQANMPEHLTHRMRDFYGNLVKTYEEAMFPEAYRAQLEKDAVARQEKERELHHNAEISLKRREDAKRVAEYADLSRDVGSAYQALESRLKEFGLTKPQYSSDSLSVITHLPEYQSYQALLNQRNAIAAELVAHPERYKLAIEEYYRIDTQKLMKQAKSHACLERVKDYQHYSEMGMTVHRDKAALSISRDIKDHFVHLKTLGLDPKILRAEALSHLRRDAQRGLSVHQREGFKVVVAYQEVMQQLGAYYAEHILPPIKSQQAIERNVVMGYERLGVERDRLAHDIMKNVEHYDAALNFYQIGISVPHFESSFTKKEELFKKAEARWYKLQANAVRFESRQRIEAYRNAVDKHDISKRLQLAHEIMQNTTGHFAAMKQQGLDTGDGLFLRISQDAKRFEAVEAYRKLDLVDRAGFKLVEAYVEAKRANGAAWGELFKSKEAQGLDNEAFYIKMSPFASAYSRARNRLAAAIQENPSYCAAGLKYFGISVEELQKSAYAHQCFANVDRFVLASNALEKGSAALKIMEDAKGHYKEMLAQSVDWRSIFRYANIVNQKKLFSEANIEERKLLRLVAEYRTYGREVGRLYASLKSVSVKAAEQSTELHKKQLKLEKLIARRDLLAAKIVHVSNSLDWALKIGERTSTASVDAHIARSKLAWGKVYTHADAHQKRIDEVKLWKQHYQETLSYFAKLSSFGKNESTQYKGLMDKFADWSMASQDRELAKISQKILNHLPNYASAMNQVGINAEQVVHYDALIKELYGKAQIWKNITHQQNTLESKNISYDANDAWRIRSVQSKIKATKPIEGTLAEKYLREHRGIIGELNSKTLRFHPNLEHWKTKTTHPALVVVARDAQGKVCGMQAIFLDKVTANKVDLTKLEKISVGFEKNELKKLSKLSLGIVGEGALIHHGIKGGVIALAEGPETALSVASAHPDWNVYTTFGVANFAKVALKIGAEQVVICADNDGLNSGTAKTIESESKKLAASGVGVKVAMPEKPLHQKKWDFNDSLKHAGVERVRKDLDASVLYSKRKTSEEVNIETKKLIHQLLGRDSQKQQEISAHGDASEKITGGTLIDTLKRYVEMELEQANLVSDMHDFAQSYDMRKAAVQAATAHANALKAYALEISSNPEVMKEMEKLKSVILPPGLSERGGFSAIQARLKDGSYTREDIQATLVFVRKGANEHTQKLQQQKLQDRDRGGRSQ